MLGVVDQGRTVIELDQGKIKPWDVLQTSCKQHNAALVVQLRDDPLTNLRSHS